MLEIHPDDILIKDLHQYMLSSIGPRPIALASTIDVNGNNNVSPFSFFNIFSAKPPIAIFSPARRIRNNSTKDTLENIKQIKEVVINVVNYDLAEKASLSSGEYPPEVDEFIKAGLTTIPSKKIRPFRVTESPVQMECKVNQIIELGQKGGAGNLIICEIILIHINENILDDNNQIDQNKIQLVGRLGKNWYCKGFDDGLFKINKPTKDLCVGFDRIPNSIKTSYILNQSDLAKLASISILPNKSEIDSFKKSPEIKIINEGENDEEIREKLHLKAKEYIENGHIKEAWQCLLIDKLNKIL